MERRFQTLAAFPYLATRARVQLRRAERRGLPRGEVARFGFALGTQMLRSDRRAALELFLNPVSLTRYLEFPFVLEHVTGTHYLDVSSPRLLSLYLASRHGATIRMINPDPPDLLRTESIIRHTGVGGLEPLPDAVDSVALSPRMYDTVYSVSVVEHIAGAYDDTIAVRWLWEAVKPGGRLILTVPVDRQYWCESRDAPLYRMQPADAAGSYFFQRLYDEEAIWSRLVESVGSAPAVMSWFGETSPDRFRAWERSAIASGFWRIVDDPLEIIHGYRQFESWSDMPGIGVCGIVFNKT